LYWFFRHEIGGKNMGKIMKKNIMMLQMPEKDTTAQRWLHDFV
jgi:hypothetical protein